MVRTGETGAVKYRCPKKNFDAKRKRLKVEGTWCKNVDLGKLPA